MIRTLVTGLIILIFLQSHAQEIYNWEDTVRQASEQIMMSDEWTARAASLAKMPDLLSKALATPGSFNMGFDSSRIAVVYAPDSSFRILTGQAVLDSEKITYYGLVQTRADEQNPIFLKDQVFSIADIEDEVLTPDSWNGAIYYNLIKFKFENRDYYMAFGFAAKSFFENSKVAEIIYFDDGTIKFGAPFFKNDEGKTKYRLSLMYAADVGARLNYDTSLAMVIFDNLIPMKSPYKERQILMVPDGSYSGYTWVQDEGWVFVDKIFHQTLAEPPREKPVLDSQRGRDINGRLQIKQH